MGGLKLDAVFLEFHKRPRRLGRSTDVYDVFSKLGSHEGVIKWHGRRGYSLFSDPGKPFGPVCLGDIARTCKELNAEHKRLKKEAALT